MAVGGTSAYSDVHDLPPLVHGVVNLAADQGFDHSCAPEQGRLLSVLARGWSGGRVGETGTGYGVGLAWMVEAAAPSTSFVSIERDAQRVAAAQSLVAAHPQVRILSGEWPELVRSGPFDLLVLDGGGKGKDPSVARPLDPTADGSLSAAPSSSTTSSPRANRVRSNTIRHDVIGSSTRHFKRQSCGCRRPSPRSSLFECADLKLGRLSSDAVRALMPLPIEERLAALHEHYVSQINASVARGRLDLVRELVDEYEDESLHLMLSSGDGTVCQLRHGAGRDPGIR